MNKYYVGQLSRAYVDFNHTDKPAKVELKFKNGDFSEEMPFKLDHEYYVVEKAELNAYMARKESLELMTGTPIWDAYNRLKVKVNELESENGNLRDFNKALGEENSKLMMKLAALKVKVNKVYGMCSAGNELKAANGELKAEVDDLKERIDHLKIIQRLLAKENTSLLTENNKLSGTCNELNATVAKLRQDLAKYEGVQEVIDIHTTCDQDCFVLWWTGYNGDEHKLEFKLIQNPMDETMCREMHIYDPTRS